MAMNWWWRVKSTGWGNKVVFWWHKHRCAKGKHVWRVLKTITGAHIGGRYYHMCVWCGVEDWDIEIDKEHQK